MKITNEKIRYIIAGTLVNASDYGIYFLLIRYCVVSLAKGISFIGAGILSYWLCKYWIFKQNQRSFVESGRFIVTNMVALATNIAANQLILMLWPGELIFALLVASLCSGALVFFCFKWWVFKPAG